ncbi:hypothetical protein OG948_57090 (plasmid) [Embleya sp. NBC_00888]|uniref:hypothetical protein n=1 Tax=Embleya sp. NBC_00888 TaxID=2975960 RepID=UPI00386E260E|nr:hypothetical protein OG948_57090 [Embleya sp. NBC_00888]
MLRGAMHLTALAADIAPDRLSFTVALRGARDSLVKATITPKAHTDGRLHQSLLREVLPRRRTRVSPRAVKRPVSAFAQRQLPALRAKGRAALQATYKIVGRISGNSLTSTEDP